MPHDTTTPPRLHVFQAVAFTTRIPRTEHAPASWRVDIWSWRLQQTLVSVQFSPNRLRGVVRPTAGRPGLLMLAVRTNSVVAQLEALARTSPEAVGFLSLMSAQPAAPNVTTIDGDFSVVSSELVH